MNTIFASRFVQMIIILTFVFFVSDFRRKNKMIPIIDHRLILLLKLSYLIPIGMYIYSIIIMDRILIVDYFVPILTTLGTYIVAKAKSDLGKYHTWTGYFAEAPEFVTRGIYANIRHPLYTGIGIFILGSGTNVLFHAPWLAALIYFICCTYIIVFLTNSAIRETRRLRAQFGKDFEVYNATVHPFLLIRQFKPSVKGLKQLRVR